MKRNIIIPILTLAMLLWTSLVFAQSGYDLSWWTIDGGGGASSGRGYTLVGTSGQADAGVSMSGSGYTLVGGFWPGAASSGPSGGDQAVYLPVILRNQ